jgi:hypothetical protein
MCFTHEEIITSGTVAVHSTHADRLWNGSSRNLTIKLLQFVDADGTPDWAGDDDAELGTAMGARRHIRSRTIREMHPDGISYLGVRELWWPTVSEFEVGITRGSDAWSRLQANAGSSFSMLVQSERVI